MKNLKRFKEHVKLLESHEYNNEDIINNMKDILLEASDMGIHTGVNTISNGVNAHVIKIAADSNILRTSVPNIKMYWGDIKDVVYRLLDYIKIENLSNVGIYIDGKLLIDSNLNSVTYYDYIEDYLQNKEDDDIVRLVSIYFNLIKSVKEAWEYNSELEEDLKDICVELTNDLDFIMDISVLRSVLKLWELKIYNKKLNSFKYGLVSEDIKRIADYLGDKFVSCELLLESGDKRGLTDINTIEGLTDDTIIGGVIIIYKIE